MASRIVYWNCVHLDLRVYCAGSSGGEDVTRAADDVTDHPPSPSRQPVNHSTDDSPTSDVSDDGQSTITMTITSRDIEPNDSCQVSHDRNDDVMLVAGDRGDTSVPESKQDGLTHESDDIIKTCLKTVTNTNASKKVNDHFTAAPYRNADSRQLVERKATLPSTNSNLGQGHGMYFSQLTTHQSMQPVYNGFQRGNVSSLLDSHRLVSQPMVVCLPPTLVNQTPQFLATNQMQPSQFLTTNPAQPPQFLANHIQSSQLLTTNRTPASQLLANQRTFQLQVDQSNVVYGYQSALSPPAECFSYVTPMPCSTANQQLDRFDSLSNSSACLQLRQNNVSDTLMGHYLSQTKHVSHLSRVAPQVTGRRTQATGVSGDEATFDPVSRAVFHIALNQLGDARRCTDDQSKSSFKRTSQSEDREALYNDSKRFKLSGY